MDTYKGIRVRHTMIAWHEFSSKGMKANSRGLVVVPLENALKYVGL